MPDHVPPAAALEEIELAVAREVVAAAPPELAAGLGLRFAPVSRAGSLVATNADLPVLNRTIGLGVLAPSNARTVDELIAPWRDASVRYLVQVVPEVETDALRGLLAARGLKRLDAWAKVWRGDEPPPSAASDLRVEPAGPAGEALGQVLCAG